MSAQAEDEEETQPGFFTWNGLSDDCDTMAEGPPTAEADAMDVDQQVKVVASAARARPGVKSKDLRTMFLAGPAHTSHAPKSSDAAPQIEPSNDREQVSRKSDHDMLAAFNLSTSVWQDELLEEEFLSSPASEAHRLEKAILNQSAELAGPEEVLPFLVATAPLLPSGRAIFNQLPAQWIDLTGRSDALGARCLFAARRHEHSVFEHLSPERFLQVPAAALDWQPALQMPADTTAFVQLAEEEPWVVQCHPKRQVIRILLRPGVLLMRMVRRGTALPSARFSWRVCDVSRGPPCENRALEGRSAISEPVGEFSILSNVEDAAHTQPPHFAEFPLRREQLRSLGWMVAQEKRRKEPFVTELREMAPCRDAPHWRLEGSLRCEYESVRGGVLADAIGYGKTACTIGLVSCSTADLPPKVPHAFAGLIPTRATLILAPTNLHSQWLCEIKKFTGDSLNVLSIPTCAQLKRLTPRDIMEADIVVSTYRLFYSLPYLNRLEGIARKDDAEFAFPRLPSSSNISRVSAEWAKAYRKAFDALPNWAKIFQLSEEENPITPERSKQRKTAKEVVTPAELQSRSQAASGRRLQRKTGGECSDSATQIYEISPSQVLSQGKRRRLTGKQIDPEFLSQSNSQSGLEDERAAIADSPGDSPSWCTKEHYVPLECFWWRRVVCDEFHELISRYPPAQVAVELFHAEFKWGLSGTPPCQTLVQIRKAAGFFGVQIPSVASDSTAEDPRQVAQEWLDAFVRRNTVELPPLEEEERIVPVRLNAQERALYDAVAQQYVKNASAIGGSDEPASDGESNELKCARESACNLLKLCSHFNSGADDVITAADEVDRQVSLRRTKAQAVEKQAANLAERLVTTVQLVRYFEPHYCCIPSSDKYKFIALEPKATLAGRLKFLGVSYAYGAKKPELLKRLFDSLSELDRTPINEAVKDVVLRADFDPKRVGRASDIAEIPPPTWAILEKSSIASLPGSEDVSDLTRRVLRDAMAKHATASDPPHRCVRLRSTLGMPKDVQARAVSHQAEAAAQHDSKTFEQEDAAWRSDPENAERLRKIVDAWKVDIEQCSTRLVALGTEAAEKQGEYQSFVETIEASQAAAHVEAVEVEAAVVPAPCFAKYGSKIEALVGHVKRICAVDAGCKVICFVQWEDLKRKISSALQAFGVEHLTLQGSVWARRAALMKFQYEAESPRMLLLSLQESASGTNLTSANHVIIVHPMEAATKEEAVAFEMQAIGRVRRPGQQRKIHVWRFVTVDTIEQEITEDHQRELWDRQRARILVSQPAQDTQSMMQVESDDEGFQHMAKSGPTDDVSTQAYVAAEVASGRENAVGSIADESDEELDVSTQAYKPIEDDVAPTKRGLLRDPAFDAMAMPPPPVPRRATAANSMDIDSTQRY